MNLKKSKFKEIFLEKEWGTGILLPIILGMVVFILVLWLSGKNSSALLWGIFSAYMLFGGFISVSKSISGLFETINFYLGIAFLVTGIIGLILWPEIKLIGTPIIIIGIILAFIAGLGWFSKKLGEEMSYLDDYY